MGTVVTTLLGGWDTAIQTLVLFMAVDYVTGLLVAGVFGTSGKSEDGSLNSAACFQGICKKVAQLLAVLVAARLDLIMGETWARTAVIFFFLGNEGLSILENLGLMGIEYPESIKNALSVLKDQGEDSGQG